MGTTSIRFEFDYDGGGKGKGGKGIIFVNDQSTGTERIEKTHPNIFSADETANLGLDNQTPITLDIGYGPDETIFNGKINE